MDTTMSEVVQFIQENDVKFIRLAFCDIFGNQKNIAIMPTELERAFEQGIHFNAAALRGFLNVEASDLLLFPDPATLSVLPWRPAQGRVVRFYCDIRYPDGTPFEGDGRHLLREANRRARRAGYSLTMGTASEFYLFELDENGHPTTIPHDHGEYFDVAPLDKAENVRRQICLLCPCRSMFFHVDEFQCGRINQIGVRKFIKNNNVRASRNQNKFALRSQLNKFCLLHNAAFSYRIRH